VQAHTLGKVGILGNSFVKGLFQDSHSIFVEIGSCLTDIEQKISWYSFFLRHGVHVE